MSIDTEEAAASRAAEGGEEKSAYVRSVFSEIAPRYDLLNHLLSFNVDRAWRRKAISGLGIDRNPGGRYLDLCAGTMDVSVELTETNGFKGTVVAADFAEPMLHSGKPKIQARAVNPVAADALALPFASGSMSGAIVAFGIRNVQNLDAALIEVQRVLVRGGRFVILEFSTPRSPLINTAYQLYFRQILPRVGGLISGHRTAYRYLPQSVANFPMEEELARRMTNAGFDEVSWRSLSLGIAAIHCGVSNG